MGLLDKKIGAYSIRDLGSIDRLSANFGGLSMNPDRRARQFASEYLETISGAEALVRSVSNDENRDRVEDAYNRWLSRFKKLSVEYINQASNTTSWAVTGRGGLNARRYQKQQDRYDKRMRSYAEAANPRGAIMQAAAEQVIRSTDSDAVFRLKEKIERLENERKTMQAVNALLKREGARTVMGQKIKTDQDEIQFLIAKAHMTEANAKALQKQSRGSWSKGVGWAPTVGRDGGKWVDSYRITNLGQQITQNKKRLKQLEFEKEQETPDDLVFEHSKFGSGTITQDDTAGRVRIMFDGKPSAEARSQLKSNGWRWAPSVGAWQRQTTENARYSLYNMLGVKFGIT